MRFGSGLGRVHKSHQEVSGRGGLARAEEATHVYVLRRPLYSAEGWREGNIYGFSPKKMRARVTQRGAKKAGPRTTLVNEGKLWNTLHGD